MTRLDNKHTQALALSPFATKDTVEIDEFWRGKPGNNVNKRKAAFKPCLSHVNVPRLSAIPSHLGTGLNATSYGDNTDGILVKAKSAQQA